MHPQPAPIYAKWPWLAAARCVAGLVILWGLLHLHQLVLSHISLPNHAHQTRWPHLSPAIKQWAINSANYLLGAIIGAWVCTRWHIRWGLIISLFFNIAALNCLPYPAWHILAHTLSCAGMIIGVISLYQIGVQCLQMRHVPIYFALILFVSLNFHEPTKVAYVISSHTISMFTHSCLFVSMVWLGINHPFGQTTQPSPQQHLSFSPLATKNFWLLLIICIMTTTWLYAWQTPALASLLVQQIRHSHLSLSIIRTQHIQTIGTGAMLAGALACCLGSCRRIALIAYACATLCALGAYLLFHAPFRFGLQLYEILGLLIGFKVLSYVICAETYDKPLFISAFTCLTLAKVTVTPLLLIGVPTLLRSFDSLPATHVLWLFFCIALALATIAAFGLHPKPRDRHLPCIKQEWRLINAGQKPLGTAFWLWFILGYYAMFKPLLLSIFVITLNFKHAHHTALLTYQILSGVYLIFATSLVIKNAPHCKYLFWRLAAFLVTAIAVAHWVIQMYSLWSAK